MNPETAQCPKCRTVFRVTPAQLAAAGGWVRCSRCGAAFDATRRYPGAPPFLEEIPDRSANPPSPEETEADRAPPGSGKAGPDPELMLARARRALRVASEEEEEFFGPPRRAGRGAAWGSALLAVLLLVQVVWFNREHFLRDPRIGPRVAAWCQRMDCDPGPVRDPERLILDGHDLEPVPEPEGTLRFSATLANRSVFSQPCPDLRLSLVDTQGTLVGVRRFKPVEYLADPPSTCPLQPGAEARVRVDLAAPGPLPLAYRFEFL